MKKANRVRIFCTKKLRNGITDSFTGVVSYDEKDAAKKAYERRGYKVYFC